MEHNGCKDIPVIIISSQDSISMVLKCFLKGAADYLIKPVRKNVLKNLWRHVWKRLCNNAGNNARKLTASQLKTEAPVKDNPANNHPNDNASSKGNVVQNLLMLKFDVSLLIIRLLSLLLVVAAYHFRIVLLLQALQLLLCLMSCVAVGIVCVAECSSFTTASLQVLF